jgi:hypothetical protein
MYLPADERMPGWHEGLQIFKALLTSSGQEKFALESAIGHMGAEVLDSRLRFELAFVARLTETETRGISSLSSELGTSNTELDVVEEETTVTSGAGFKYASTRLIWMLLKS